MILFSSEGISNKHCKSLFSNWMDGKKPGDSCELLVRFILNNFNSLKQLESTRGIKFSVFIKLTWHYNKA